ncbi:MAG: FAD-binding protein [Flavobacteriales bacterium]|nr:FAD-binding protein [Flavobacteriales bacterium]MBP6696510.1 FAD-binding protein [Flavobacteriales bacterium]
MAAIFRTTIKYSFGRPVWRNSTNTVKLHPLALEKPSTVEEMKACVTRAIRDKLRIRATGPGHSFSDAPYAEDLLVDTSALTTITPKYLGDEHLVEVEAGVTVRRLNKKLDALGKSIRAMGGYDKQSIAGAIQTGTHGSSLKFGAMSAMVRSVVLVTRDMEHPDRGRAYRIEPANGPTPHSPSPASGPTLIKDDDLFHSVVVSFGAMGLVYSLVLEVEPFFCLKEVRRVSNWTDVKQQLRNGLLEAHGSVLVQINPYLPGEDTALIITHDRVPDDQVPSALRRRGADLGYFLSALWGAMRNPSLLVAGHFRITYWIMVLMINMRPKRIGRTFRSAIRSQQDDGYTHRAHKVMYQGAAHFKLRAYDTECAIPLRPGDYLATLDALIAHLRDLNGRYASHLSAPIGLRFVKGSPLFLTPEHGHDVCYVDLPVLKHAYGHSNIVGRLQEFFRDPAHLGIPHWGKRNERFTAQDIEIRYPRLNDWKMVRDRFDKERTFANRFTERVVGI